MEGIQQGDPRQALFLSERAPQRCTVRERDYRLVIPAKKRNPSRLTLPTIWRKRTIGLAPDQISPISLNRLAASGFQNGSSLGSWGGFTGRLGGKERSSGTPKATSKSTSF
jgi:hypothetical protein